MNRAALIDWLNAFKADPFSTGADKVDRLLEICASRIEAQRGETGTGSISEADESLTAESGDAQTPKSVTKGA